MEKINTTSPQPKHDKSFIGANGTDKNILSRLLDNIPSPVFYVDREYRYKYANKAYAVWLGTDPSKVMGSLVRDFLKAESFPRIKKFIDEALSGKEVRYEEYQEELPMRPDNSFIETIYRPDFDETGNINGCIVCIEKTGAEVPIKNRQKELQDYLDDTVISQHWVNRKGIIIWANKAELNMLGYSESEYFGHHISEFHRDKKKIEIILCRLLANETISQYETELLCKDGTVRTVLLSSNVVWENGNFVHTKCFIIDITAQKKAERELKDSREYYFNLIQGLPAAVYITDKDGYITLYNKAAAMLWGRSPEIGKEMWCGSLKIFKPDGVTPLPPDTCPMAVTLKEERAVTGEEIIIERPDGSRKNVLPHPQPIFNTAGKIIGAVNMLLDITERKTAEEYRSKLAAIVQFSEDIVISKTTEGIITSWNPAAERLYGYKEEEMIGQHISKLIPADRINEEPEILERIKKGERIPAFETKRIAKNGKVIDVSITISPIRDGSGNVIGASKIAQDISKRIEDRKKIHENEERLRMASESTQLGTWEFHPVTKKLIWSDECKRIYGLPSDSEPESQFVADHNYPEDTDYIHREVVKAMHPDNDGNFKMEYRIIRAGDNDIRWLKVQGKVYFDDDEKPQRFIGTMLDITEEKKAVQWIRESEERFRMAVESTKLGTWEFQPSKEKLHWSAECRKIYGVPADMEIDFNFFTEHIHPEDREYTETAIQKAMDSAGDGNYDVECRIIRYNDKQPRWIRAQGKVYFNNRQPERFIGTVLDITKEKLQQEELIESVELFQTMADNVPAMIRMSGTDKFNDYFNRTWLEFTGRTLDEESNEGWLEGVHPDDVEKCITIYNDSLKEQNGFYTEYRLRRHDGQYRWIADNSLPRFSPDGLFLGFISACIDIDDQKCFREKILESELLFKTISNTSPAGLWMTDQHKTNIFVNNTWLKWNGNSFNSQAANEWLSFILEEDREKVSKHFSECFEERKRFVAEFRIPRSDGSMRWCMTEGKPYSDITGSFAGYAGSVTDISEIKRLEQRKDDFIKMASHELKTPITSINGYVQLLLNIYNEAETEKLQMSRSTVRSSLGTIAKQVTKLTRLISELLDLSKIESGKLELHCAEFDLNELVEETVEDIRHATPRHAIIVENNFEGKVYGDKDRIGQVLMNLLNNAIKYSPDADNVKVYMEEDKNFAVIKIKDYGIGIDKKEHTKIFERFYRVEGKTEQTYPGFGIGLFIVSEIIYRHKGTIHVKSEKGKGSEFTINIPLDYRK